MAHRSAGSVFGAAKAVAKRDDKELIFDSEEEAKTVAGDHNERVRSMNVWYTVEPRSE
jgi:hypothetical protein